MRHASILHRKPRTRRDRALVRLHAIRESGRRRWDRLRRNRRLRAAHARAEDVFVQLGHSLRPESHEPVTPARHRWPRVRHHH